MPDEKIDETLNIEESFQGDIAILSIKGKLDTNLSCSLEKKAVSLIKEGHTKLILDLSEVNYINSSGLRMLLSIKKQIKSLPGKLIVCSLTPEVLEIMKICGFDHVLEISENKEEAIKQSV